MLTIQGFPHAQYDSKTNTGFLAYYYPSSAVRDHVLTEEQWRHQSYSPDILNYKEGRDHHIKWFVEPFLKLIKQALTEAGSQNAYLVPIPSSMASNDLRFSQSPRKKGTADSRNRDNRNTVFCNFLSIRDNNLIVADCLVRKLTKPEKATWDANQHAQSMEISVLALPKQEHPIFIAIDDITTDGGTLAGAKILLEKTFPKATIICLAIGYTQSPHKFIPLPSC